MCNGEQNGGAKRGVGSSGCRRCPDLTVLLREDQQLLRLSLEGTTAALRVCDHKTEKSLILTPMLLF